MKKLLIGVALASTCLATPALARDGAIYFELDGGVMKVDDMDFDVANVEDAVTFDHDHGFDFGAIVGYDFGAFRIEGEASYRQADLDEIEFGTGATVGLFDGLFTPGELANGVNPSGETRALSFMANALADFGPDDGLQFFAGGGVGWAKVNVDASFADDDSEILDESDSGFAWQLLAGVRAPLTETIDVGVKYRFFNASNVDLGDDEDEVETRFRSHSLLGTFAFNFGGAEPMPEPAYVPPPPPPPPVYTPPPPPPPPPVYTPPPVGERG